MEKRGNVTIRNGSHTREQKTKDTFVMLKEQLEKMDVKMEEERKKESDEMVQRDDAATKRFSMWIKGEK